MSTVNNAGDAFQQFNRPAAVSNASLSLPVSANNNEARQRMPLPQAPASEPSLLKMRTNPSVPGVRGG